MSDTTACWLLLRCRRGSCLGIRSWAAAWVGRTVTPLSLSEKVEQVEIWVYGGAPCPDCPRGSPWSNPQARAPPASQLQPTSCRVAHGKRGSFLCTASRFCFLGRSEALAGIAAPG